MRGLYSYNVLDSPGYIQAKKIERRIQIYSKRQRTKKMQDNLRKFEKANLEAEKGTLSNSINLD